MTYKKKIAALISEIDSEIVRYQEQKAAAETKRLASWDFDDKNYLSGVESFYEGKIEVLNQFKNLIKKHLGT